MMTSPRRLNLRWTFLRFEKNGLNFLMCQIKIKSSGNKMVRFREEKFADLPIGFQLDQRRIGI